MLTPETWTKSSRSVTNECVTTRWTKSSYSANNGCIETRQTGDTIEVKDSKTPHSPILEFTPAAWTDFLTAVKTGTIAP